MKVLVVGGGVAGVAVTRELVRSGVRRIVIVSKNPVGESESFSDIPDWYLANTTPSTMSLKSEDPNNFITWLGLKRPPLVENFVPRVYFGDYLHAVWEEVIADAALSGVSLEVLRGEIVRLDAIDTSGASGHLLDGRTVHVDAIVMCTGVGPPRCPGVVSQQDREGGVCFYGPLDRSFLPYISNSQGKSILVLGASLSAVDVAKSCFRFGNSVTIASRTGTLPSVRTDLPLSEELVKQGRIVDVAQALFQFLDHSRHSSGFPASIKALISEYLPAKGHDLDPIALLNLEIEQASQGRNSWQDYVGWFIDSAHLFWPLLPAAEQLELRRLLRRDFMRYISAIPVGSANEVSAAYESRLLFVKPMPTRVIWDAGKWVARFENKDTIFDALVIAAGYENPTWVSILNKNPAEAIPSEDGLLAPGFNGRVLGVGAITHETYPIVNYIRTIVLQSRVVSGQLRRKHIVDAQALTGAAR